MRSILPRLSPPLAALLALVLLAGCQGRTVTVQIDAPEAGVEPVGKVVFLAGRDSHLPGAHEHGAGVELLARHLRERQPGITTATIRGGWPADDAVFAGADALVLYCDGGRSHPIVDHLDTFNRLLDEGVGIVALHYCLEVPKDSPAAEAMLRAIGGYFETWWSVNPIWTARYTALPEHPVTRGIAPFELKDEWYFNMRFAGHGVTPILSAIAPASTMRRRDGPHSGNEDVRRMVADGLPQTTAWTYERADGGRGFGYTGGHYHANWQLDAPRELVLNAIEWVALKP